MGLLADIFDFLDDLSIGSSYYIENSTEWADKVWRRLRYTESGEARLVQIGEKLYRQFYVELEDNIEGCYTDKNDSGCNVERMRLKKAQKDQLSRMGYVTIKKYK